MFENKIKFIASKEYIEGNKTIHPIPAKNNIPHWFKKLEHTNVSATVKGCMPFLDTLTAGYILKMPVDYYLKHNFKIEGKEQRATGFQTPLRPTENVPYYNLNINGVEQSHPTRQLEGSPLIEKNKNQSFHKILNPWTIKTPPGYSTLFVPPLNNCDDRFSILPGIVDTDTFPNKINFPFTVNGDKYETLDTTIEYGTPYVQAIPFKRDSWKMEINEEKQDTNIVWYFSVKHLLNNYKKLFWSKKSWK